MEQIKQANIKWILNDSVVVVDGWCWAVTPSGRTICIGREVDVLKEGKK